jgi:dUTP pyrophosphatase
MTENYYLGSNEQRLKQLLEKMKQNSFEIKVEVLEGGKMPTKAHSTDAGFDLYATSDIVIYPGQVMKHPLNIKMELPLGTWAEITSKSGLGSKGLLVYAGVIDQAYRGIPHVVFTNLWVIDQVDAEGFPLMRTTPIVIKKGEKLAQMILNPYSDQFYLTQVDRVSEDTDRGAGGFGSSGV